jgi:hypothetical protein
MPWQPPQAEHERRGRAHRQRDLPDRHMQEREVCHEDPAGGDADRVGKREAGQELAPRLGEPQQRQKSGSEDDEQQVRRDQGDDAARHGALMRETKIG